MRKWTDEERAAQALKIRQQKPWKHASGARMQEGKEKSRMNALKHGIYSAETKAIYAYFAECRHVIQQARILMRMKKEALLLLAADDAD